MALNTTPAVPVHELHQFLLMGIQGQKKNRKIGALTYKSELAVTTPFSHLKNKPASK